MSDNQVARIIDALGGMDNIRAVEPCITRLRFEVVDPGLVDTGVLNPPVCYGASLVGTAVQVIVGPQAELLLDELRDAVGEI
ncbi:MAG: PTS transporter subunit EIIB [Actinomycetaceae bacterium]|nr:PTS transporter subunit EIIB [Actinomycetaceae bacterium]MDU0970584.1 PTS transporter subunit EIIB [Actinomycetaceae bacterium]MDU1064511.1 PTS transporter subunit EIIB [Cutibacterium avidum]